MTINAAVTKYQTTGCEFAFIEIYEYIYEGGSRIVTKYARRYQLDELDVESLINEKLLDIATKFDGTQGKFKNAVHSAIKRGCIDLLRKKVRRDDHETEVMYEDDDGGQFEIYEVLEVAPTTNEENILEPIKKHDQRQLIVYLLSKADNSTLTSTSAFLATDSYRSAAKHLGVEHKTVKSRIRKLSKFYERKKFGDYYDYFNVPTVFVG